MWVGTGQSWETHIGGSQEEDEEEAEEDEGEEQAEGAVLMKPGLQEAVTTVPTGTEPNGARDPCSVALFTSQYLTQEPEDEQVSMGPVNV